VEYQLGYLSRIKNVLLKQFYLKGTSGKMVDGLSDEDYAFFLESTRFPGMHALLGGLKLYFPDGMRQPLFDLPHAYRLVSELNKKLTTIQLSADNIKAIYKCYTPDSCKIYDPETTKELISLLMDARGDVHKKKPKTAKKPQSKLEKKKAFGRYQKHIKEKLEFFKTELRKTNKFVSLDFEAFEFNQKKITEVGYSVFENGECKNYHYIIKEIIGKLNGKFVADNKFNFAFGESEILPLADAMNKLSKILSDADYLVAHGVGNELKWMRKNNIKVGSGLKTIDTGTLGAALMKVKQRVSLTRILTFLNIEHGLLHNAGNDSFYTMKALQHMAD